MRDDEIGRAVELTPGRRLGRLMRQDRDARGLRQADVADALHVERSNVSQFETGIRVPGTDYLRRWLAVYGPNAQLEAEYRIAVEAHGARVNARRARRDAAAPHAQPLEPTGTGEAAATTIVQALCDSARSNVQLSWDLWIRDGDAAGLDGVTTIIDRLEQAVARTGGALRRHALTLLGYAHEAMGRRAFDQLRYADAIGHFDQMHELGTVLADADLAALALLHLGDMTRRRGRYAAAIDLLNASEQQARAAIASTRGRRWQTLARTHAECGNRSQFLHAIDRAEACADEAAGEGIAAKEFTATEVRHERAHGLTLLGESQAALAIYEASEPSLSFRGVRDRASFLIIKAQALAHGGDLDEGVRLAIEGLGLARGYGSPRHVSRVQRMDERLRSSGYGASPHLDALREALSAA